MINGESIELKLNCAEAPRSTLLLAILRLAPTTTPPPNAPWAVDRLKPEIA
jgi:hypothetical protein